MERKIDGSHVLAVVCGLAAGGAAGYLLGRKMAKKGVEWRIASEVDATRQHYQARIAALSTAQANAARKGSDPYEADTSAVGDESRTNDQSAEKGHGISGASGADVPGAGGGDTAETGDRRVHAPDPRGFVPDTVGPGDLGRRDPLEGLDGEDPDEDYGDEDDHDSGPDGADLSDGSTQQSPYVISLEDFTDQCESFHKITIYWYADDEVLVDEREEPIADVINTIGEEFKTQFASNSSTGGPGSYCVYVRNRRLHIDYEVALREGSYAEAIGYGKP